MRNQRMRRLIEKTVDFTDYTEFDCQNKNGVFHYTNVVWVREYPNGETIEVPQESYVSLVEGKWY